MLQMPSCLTWHARHPADQLLTFYPLLSPSSGPSRLHGVQTARLPALLLCVGGRPAGHPVQRLHAAPHHAAHVQVLPGWCSWAGLVAAVWCKRSQEVHWRHATACHTMLCPVMPAPRHMPCSAMSCHQHASSTPGLHPATSDDRPSTSCGWTVMRRWRGGAPRRWAWSHVWARSMWPSRPRCRWRAR